MKLTDALTVANIALALSAACIQLRCVRRTWNRGGQHWAWHIASGVMLIYWACLYLYVGLHKPGLVEFCARFALDCSGDNWFGEVFVRPAFTFTLALWLALSLRRWKGCT